MTKALVFNCSPKMEKSNTALILDPFLEGMRNAGAEIELFYTRRLRINACTGEFHCWLKHPGKCYQDDDMQMLYPKIQEADILVFATPVYADGISGPMKTLLDRTIPLNEPVFELRAGHCRHPPRKGTMRGKLVLVSNCGFWELDNFDPLVVHMKAVCKNMDREFAGALLRPHGPALKPMKEMGHPVEDVQKAAKDAGAQLIQEGKISSETLKIVSRELLPLETYITEINKSFKQVLASLHGSVTNENRRIRKRIE
ncbi:MAG: flavodoxin family protein [Candidatus Bathyarchaeota archaeon]|nr:flavodoxin family protein [Candidatus Bathyarchaeota archaeon]UCC28443.1 MAG: flavodoxin family protein [Candidatus Bathyarchaeota archaeon]